MIYAVICEKGGTGKTTTSEALGDGLRERGRSVLTIDADPQGNMTAAMNGDRTLTLYDVFTGYATAGEAIQTTPRGDLIAASRFLSDPKGEIRAKGFSALRSALEGVGDRYEDIVIDCPPSLGILSVNALTAADAVIVPVTADAFSLAALAAVHSTVQAAKAENPGLTIRGILLTRFNARTIVNREIAAMIENVAAMKMDTTVFRTRIRECSAIRTAQANRQSIFRYAPRSNAAADYRAFLDELTGENSR